VRPTLFGEKGIKMNKRFDDTYNFYDKKRHDRLSDLLELFEYLRGDDENPLLKWFPDLKDK
jgi:hypothetical protein